MRVTVLGRINNNTTYFPGSEEGGSEQTRPLQSSSLEPSEASTPEFDPISDKRLPPPPQFGTKEHVIQIDEPESPTRTLYITQEEDATLQKPITPAPSEKPEQILSASALESQYKSLTAEPTAGEGPSRAQSAPGTSKSTLASPATGQESRPASRGSARVSPSPSPTPSTGDRGRSKVTGKMVSGWL